MTMRRKRCAECGSVFYTQNNNHTLCDGCWANSQPRTAPVDETKPKSRTKAAPAAPDATE